MNDKRGETIESVDNTGFPLLATRRAVLAAGGTLALGSLAGCTGLDGVLGQASERVVGTTVSAPAAFYPGRTSWRPSNRQDTDTVKQVFRTGPGEVRLVPATVGADSREITLEGWSTSGATKATMDKGLRFAIREGGRTVGPKRLSGGDDDTTPVLMAEVELLNHCTTAQNAVKQRDQPEAERALNAFIDVTEETLRPALEKCSTGVCETVRKNSDIRMEGVRVARDAVAEGTWTVAVRELAGVEEIVLSDIERLDDALVERNPERPRLIDVIEYLRDNPTIGERFTVCLPDAKLPGDRGSLAAELTPGRVLSYFAASDEEDGRHTPFHNKYRPQFGVTYDGDGCIRTDGPVSLHRDLACRTILSAELDTYRTENRAIMGYSTEGGAVVCGAPASADTDGTCVFVAADGTLREPESLDSWGEIILGEDRDMAAPDDADGTVSVSPTLVCPVAVTPDDCPCPLPGVFYVRRIIHDEQVIFTGGWLLDTGALYDNSVSLLFEEGPTEIASVTPTDIESDEYDDRVVEQFSRRWSQHGSAVITGDFDSIVEAGPVPKAQLTAKLDSVLSDADTGDDVGTPLANFTALDAPLVHLSGAGELSDAVKLESGRGTTTPHSKFKAEIYVLKDD